MFLDFRDSDLYRRGKDWGQIMLQNRFWNEDAAAFFSANSVYSVCFTDEGDSEVEDAGDTNEDTTEGDDQPPSKVRKMLSQS